MKKALILIVTILFCTIALAQRNSDMEMVDIQIADENSSILINIRTSLRVIIQEHKYLVKLNDEARALRNDMIDDNARAIIQRSNGQQTGYEYKDTVLTRLTIKLSLLEGKDYYQVAHIMVEPDKPDDKTKGEEISKSKYLLSHREIQRLVAYEIFERYFVMSDEARRTFVELQSFEAEIEKKMSEEQARYTLLSFLPPVNQFSAPPLSGGKANGIAIVSGYTLSIGGFIWCNASFNANKRRYDNVSVDLTEADKARAYYKGQMDICRGGQIASAILFAGTYIYGVANALANREAYSGVSKDTSMKIAPVAYGNGAGIALVYRF